MNRRVVVHSASGSTASMRNVDWHEVRAERDALLDRTDWRAVKDRVLPNEWKEYRQALRDITEHPDANTAADNWPVMPDE
jgi:hypothetical protein